MERKRAPSRSDGGTPSSHAYRASPHLEMQTTSPASPSINDQPMDFNETKTKLQIKIDNRPHKMNLIDKHYLPPENVPGSKFHVITKLKQQQTRDTVSHKIRARPSKKDLLNKGILHDTSKRRNVSQKLSSFLAIRPGPLDVWNRGYFTPSEQTNKRSKKFTFHHQTTCEDTQETIKFDPVVST